VATQYIVPSDIATWGVNGAALTGIPFAEQTLVCQSVSAEADASFRARYNLPLTGWGDDVRACLARIAAYELLVIRGFNPELGAYSNLAMRAEASRTWLRAIARQEQHPDVTATPPQVAEYDEPRIITTARLWTVPGRYPRS